MAAESTPTSMIPTSILVPLRGNDGQPQSRRLFRELEQLLLDQFGGFTNAGLKGGIWRADDGTVYRDSTRQYDVWMAGWRNVPDFLEVLRWLALNFKQEAIAYTIAGIPDLMPGPAP
jgi:hypothetical protein